MKRLYGVRTIVVAALGMTGFASVVMGQLYPRSVSNGLVTTSTTTAFSAVDDSREQGPQITMPFATVSSTGGVVFDDGSFAILGQPFVGVTSNSDYTMIVGAIPALVSPPPPVRPPLTAPPPHDIRKNRYISIDPRGAGQTNPSSLHIRVSIDSTQVNGLIGTGPWWATAPVNGAGLSPATCISVVTTTKPAVEPDWSGCPTLHLTGCPIVPTTTYAIAVEAASVLSADALFDTQAKPGSKWLGDAVGNFTGPAGNPPNVWTSPNGTVNIDDAVAAIKTLNDPTALNATHLSVTDIHPVLNGVQMNLQVNINDVLVIIFGFQGKTYGEVASPFPDDEIPDLTQCP
ncbi:MAG: hypothetical protein IH987_08935 [Planctomycetes bacterium]|nr:hypothetical protein [Planctomycetota bacterium]